MTTDNKTVNIIDLGTIDYKEAWDYQEALFKKTVDRKIQNRSDESLALETDNYLLVCEHPHVYTLGKSGDPGNLLLNDSELQGVGAAYYKINRGGDITYHGPGQLVCYPVLDLENFFTDIHKYLRLLEESVILTLKEYGITGKRIDGLTGVWIESKDPHTEPGKVCAMGVRTSRWVTMHGIALNVNTDLSYFNHIIPCGIEDKNVTSLQQELGREIDIEDVKSNLIQNIANVFSMEVVNEK